MLKTNEMTVLLSPFQQSSLAITTGDGGRGIANGCDSTRRA
jgi:hypothetical protein